MTISAPSTFRQFQNIPPINRAANDYMCESGVRICVPVYIDPPTALRKDVLNQIREIAKAPLEATQQPDTITGIQVVSYSTRQPEIEAYLGMSLDNLRNVLFQRGGLEVSLVLKLQQVTGIELVVDKDVTAAFKARQNLVKTFEKSYPFHSLGTV